MLTGLAGQHLRQPDEREQSGAQDGKGSKQAKVAQQVGIDKQQTRKGTDGGDAAQQYRFYLVAQQLFRVADILVMRQDMEHIAHGHTQHHTTNAQGQK